MKKNLFYIGILTTIITTSAIAANQPIDTLNKYYEICENSKKLIKGYDTASVNNMKNLLYTADNFGAEIYLSNCRKVKNIKNSSSNKNITVLNSKQNKKTGILSVSYKYATLNKPLTMKLKQKQVGSEKKWLISW